MKVNVIPDCDNAPKKDMIKNLTIAFAAYDLDKVMEFMHPDVVWTLVGDESMLGKDNFRAELEKMRYQKVVELSIFSIITHGKEAAVNGEMRMEDGKNFGFADFYKFTSAAGKMVKSIHSYVSILK